MSRGRAMKPARSFDSSSARLLPADTPRQPSDTRCFPKMLASRGVLAFYSCTNTQPVRHPQTWTTRRRRVAA